MTNSMVVSSGGDSTVQPKETWSGGSSALRRAERQARPAPAGLSRRHVEARCVILAALVLAYRASLGTLYGLLGSPAFLFGVSLCLLAAVWLGVRGALVVIVSVAFIDRGQALLLPASAETGPSAGIIALLLK